MRYQFLRNAEIYRELVVERMLEVERSLWIASANLKNMHVGRRRGFQSVLRAFRDLVGRGVEIRILHAGVPSDSYLHSLREAGLIGVPGFTMKRCPRVHFKCVVGDASWAFMGSPNLTGAGMGAKSEGRRNFEIGILTGEPAFRRHVKQLFLDVWEGRMCKTCTRKRFCPVPLEQPDF